MADAPCPCRRAPDIDLRDRRKIRGAGAGPVQRRFVLLGFGAAKFTPWEAAAIHPLLVTPSRRCRTSSARWRSGSARWLPRDRLRRARHRQLWRRGVPGRHAELPHDHASSRSGVQQLHHQERDLALAWPLYSATSTPPPDPPPTASTPPRRRARMSGPHPAKTAPLRAARA